MMLLGLYYKIHQGAGQTKLAMAHFWLSTIGATLINLGVYMIYAGMPEADPVAAIGSIGVILGMVIFTAIVFKTSDQ